MRLSIIGAFIFAFVAAVVVAPHAARAAESHVWVNNATDKYVWVTAFRENCTYSIGSHVGGHIPVGSCVSSTSRHIVHEWCTAPGASSKQGFHEALNVVHVLVTTHPNCGRPIVKDWTLQFPQNNGSQSIKQQYNVTMHNKSYDVQAVP